MIPDHIFILSDLFYLIVSVMITIIILIPHYKAAPFSFLTFCPHWLITAKLSSRLFIKFRRMQRNVICSLHYMHYSSFLIYKINLQKLRVVTQAKSLFLHVFASKAQVKTLLILTSASSSSVFKTSRETLPFLFSLPSP